MYSVAVCLSSLICNDSLAESVNLFEVSVRNAEVVCTNMSASAKKSRLPEWRTSIPQKFFKAKLISAYADAEGKFLILSLVDPATTVIIDFKKFSVLNVLKGCSLIRIPFFGKTSGVWLSTLSESGIREGWHISPVGKEERRLSETFELAFEDPVSGAIALVKKRKAQVRIFAVEWAWGAPSDRGRELASTLLENAARFGTVPTASIATSRGPFFFQEFVIDRSGLDTDTYRSSLASGLAPLYSFDGAGWFLDCVGEVKRGTLLFRGLSGTVAGTERTDIRESWFLLNLTSGGVQQIVMSNVKSVRACIAIKPLGM